MANVVTSSVADFSSDPYWQENKTDKEPVTIADISKKIIADYANKIDQQFKSINEAAHGDVSWPTGSFADRVIINGKNLALADVTYLEIGDGTDPIAIDGTLIDFREASTLIWRMNNGTLYPISGQNLGQVGNEVGTVHADVLSASVAVTYPEYTVATLPAAGSYQASMIMVTDETGGYVPAFSDGTNWRRVTDRAIVS